MKKINRDIVSALIISKDGRLLMGMKDPVGGGVYSDCWHIPGGGIEEGEDQVDALIREIKEEVGVDITNAKIKLIDDKGNGMSIKKVGSEEVECHMKFYVYQVNLSTEYKYTQLTMSDDLHVLEWVELDKLSNYKLTPPSITLFKRLGWLRE